MASELRGDAPGEGMVVLIARAFREWLVPLLRRALPSPAKERLKRVWDPTARLSMKTTLGEVDESMNEVVEAGVERAVTILVVTYNGLDYTRVCLTRILHLTDSSRVSVLVVDNGSTDGTPAYLKALCDRSPRVEVILNGVNRGFAPALNQGIARSSGSHLVLMNNDTIVTPGWLDRLLSHLQDPAIGLVVPVTNASGNASRVDDPYDDLASLDAVAEARASRLRGRIFDIDVAAMYCVALTRTVCQRIGPLDERFEIGFFEDEDYSHRARLAGLRVVCAEDVFIHHFGQASFRKLPLRQVRRLFAANRNRFREKWDR